MLSFPRTAIMSQGGYVILGACKSSLPWLSSMLLVAAHKMLGMKNRNSLVPHADRSHCL